MSEFRLATASLTDALCESLSQRIVSGQVAPGEKLTEARIATEYDVARPTAKACLERLTVLGLLRRTAHKSAVVPVFDADDIADLFLGRSTVECAAIRELARRGTTPPEARQAQIAIEGAAREGDFGQQVAADIRFHVALVVGTGSERLRRMHEIIIGEVHLTMGLHSAHQATSGSIVAAEHSAILHAVAAGDPDAASAAMETHLRAARDRILARIDDGQPLSGAR